MDLAQMMQVMNSMGGQGGQGPGGQPPAQPQPNPAQFQNPGMPQQAMTPGFAQATGEGVPPPGTPQLGPGGGPPPPGQQAGVGPTQSNPQYGQDQAMMDYLTRAGGLDPMRQRAMRQQAMAQQLRKMSTPPGQRTAGGFVIPTSPWETAAHIGGGVTGGVLEHQGEQGMEQYGGELRKSLGEMRKKYFDQPEQPKT